MSNNVDGLAAKPKVKHRRAKAQKSRTDGPVTFNSGKQPSIHDLKKQMTQYTDRHQCRPATGTYTAERLKALEDNHMALLTFMCAFLTDIPIEKTTALEYVVKAREIRKEGGMK